MPSPWLIVELGELVPELSCENLSPLSSAITELDVREGCDLTSPMTAGLS